MKLIVSILLSLASCCAYAQQSIPVLMYHHVTSILPPGSTVVSLDLFNKQLDLLKNEGYTTIRIDQLTNFIKTGASLPSKTIAITFDDGWQDQLDAALALHRRKMSATFYVISGMIEHPQYMNKASIYALSVTDNFEIGAHTHTHFMEWAQDLDKLDTRTMVGEIVMSKMIIEQITHKPVKSFAWPFGYTRDGWNEYIAAAGFTNAALVTRTSNNLQGMSPFSIQRLTVDGTCNIKKFKEMLDTKTAMNCKR